MNDAIKARAQDVQDLLAELKAIEPANLRPMQAARLLVELDESHSRLNRHAGPIIDANLKG